MLVSIVQSQPIGDDSALFTCNGLNMNRLSRILADAYGLEVEKIEFESRAHFMKCIKVDILCVYLPAHRINTCESFCTRKDFDDIY